jgi:predicted DsbA family dithiol-disulfide isomerase
MPLTIDVWSDYLCPYCYITARSLAALKQRYPITIRYHLFEIQREAPVSQLDKRSTLLDILRPHADSTTLSANINQGPTDISSRNALVATFVAGGYGRMHPYFHRVMRAYWEEAEPIDRSYVLVKLAADIGLDRYAFAKALRSRRYSTALAADLSHAHQRDIEQVPTLVFNGELTLTGAQPYEALESTVQALLGRSGQATTRQ